MSPHVLRQVVFTLERPTTDQAAVWPVVAVADQVSTEVVSEQEVTSTRVACVREFHAGVVRLRMLDHVLAQLHGLQKLSPASRAHVRHYLASRVLPLPMPQLQQIPLSAVCPRLTCGISVNVWVNPVTKHTVCVLFHFAATLERLTAALQGQRLRQIFNVFSLSSLQTQSITVAGTVC